MMTSASKERIDEQFSGSELAETTAKERKEIPKEIEPKDPEKKYQIKLFVLAALGLCFLAGAGYFYMNNKKEKLPRVDKLSGPPGILLIFDSFIIPFKKHNEFTYISLGVSFRLQNNELEREMTEKKDRIRGVLYEILKEEINRTDEIPPLENLKEYIIKGVNQLLATGKVTEAYLMDFLAV
jgi:flagellar basal body-associated protein FliL